MSLIKPFAGWRYDPGKTDCAQVTLPPRDRVSPEMQGALYRAHDRNAVRLLLGRRFSTDTEYDNAHTRAAAHLDAWRAEGLFLRDRPAIYVYQRDCTRDGRPVSCRGFFARMFLGDGVTPGAFPHAATLEAPLEDRLRQLTATRANLEPVFGLLTDPSGDISRSLYGMCQYPPVNDFTDSAGVRHRFWVLDDPEQAPAFCDGCSREQIIIAGGHHLYAAALRYRDEVREAMRQAGQTPPEPGALPEDYVMACIVPDGDAGLTVGPVHRLARGITDMAGLLKRLEENFTVEKAGDAADLERKLAAAPGPGFGMAWHGGFACARLRWPDAMARRAPGTPPEWQGMDVTTLHLMVLEDLLGIDAGKIRAGAVLYSPDAGETIDAAKSDRDNAQCGFILRAPSLAGIRNAARAGALLPARGADVGPRPLTGLVFNFFW